MLVVIPGDDPRQIADSPHLERLRSRSEVRLYRDRPGSSEEQAARVEEADVLLNSRGQLKWSAELLAQLPRLKMITTCSIGTDSIDLSAARQRGIVVCNVPEKTAPVVAEHAVALMLGIAKNLAYQTAELRQGRWTQRDNVLLAGRTLGVIGAGAIGARVIRLGQALGMQVLAWTFHPSQDRSRELGAPFVELPELLAASDVVSLHVRLSKQSEGLIGRDQLSQMRPGALLVNTARGGVVDTAALVDALHSGRLGGAALDVFPEEPLPGDHPLLSCPHLVMTPHAADQTPEGMDLLNEGAVDNVLAFLDGAPRNVVSG
jgi:D-3-phosphoglycerate dehydrogenase